MPGFKIIICHPEGWHHMQMWGRLNNCFNILGENVKDTIKNGTALHNVNALSGTESYT